MEESSGSNQSTTIFIEELNDCLELYKKTSTKDLKKHAELAFEAFQEHEAEYRAAMQIFESYNIKNINVSLLRDHLKRAFLKPFVDIYLDIGLYKGITLKKGKDQLIAHLPTLFKVFREQKVFSDYFIDWLEVYWEKLQTIKHLLCQDTIDFTKDWKEIHFGLKDVRAKVLEPLWSTWRFWINRTDKDDFDPLAIFIKQQIGQALNSNEELPDNLSDTLTIWLASRIAKQATFEEYAEIYKLFLNKGQLFLLQTLKKLGADSELIEAIGAIPNANGYRQNEYLQQEDLREQILQITTPMKQLPQKDKKPPIGLSCTLCQKNNREKPHLNDFKDITVSLQLPGEKELRILDPIVVQHLIDPKTGRLREKDIHASRVSMMHRHRVVSLIFNRGNDTHAVYIKEKPDHPLMDHAIYLLRQRLFGHGAPPNTVAKLIVINRSRQYTYNYDYPVLISLAVGSAEDNLKNCLEKNRKFKLSLKHLYESALFDAVAHPGDGDPRSYQIKTLKNNESVPLCIDNDQYFVQPVVDTMFGRKLQMRSILFCFAELKNVNQTILKQVLETFTRLNIKVLLKDWLETLIDYEAKSLALFNLSEREQYFKENTNTLHLLFPEGSIFRLATDLYNLQSQARNSLEKNKFPSIIKLINHLHDLSDYKYQQEFNRSNIPPSERFRSITNSAQVSKTSSQSLQASLGKVPTLQEIEKEKKYSPQKALEELELLGLLFIGKHTQIKSVSQNSQLIMDFEKSPMIKEKQRVLIEMQLHRQFTHIAIRYCKALDDALLKKLLIQTGFRLVYLRLDHCPHITSASIETIVRNCPNLEKLSLIYNQGLTSIKIIPFYESWLSQTLIFSKITYLNVSHNSQLTSLELDLKALEILKIESCEKLIHKNTKLHLPNVKIICTDNIVISEKCPEALNVYQTKTPLILAIEKGKIEVVRWLIEKSVSIEEKNNALLFAVQQSNFILVKYLVEEAKANIHAENNEGETALSLAVRKGHLAIAQYLYKYSADIHHKNKNNRTPLMIAAGTGQTETVRWLVAQGAKVEEKDADGWTALLCAVGFGHLETVRYLVEEAKANIHAEDKARDTALSLAIKKGHLAIAQYMYKYSAAIYHKNRNKVTLLMKAAEKGKTETVRWLVTQGAKVEEKDADGWTALLYAVDFGHLETVHYLVEKAKVNIHAEDNNGNTALSLAAMRGHLTIVQYLHKHGANIHHKNKNKVTLVMLAAASGKIEIICWLVTQGAKLEAKDARGWTALLCAVDFGHLETVHYLVEKAKANIHAEDNNGNTALSLAARKNHLAIVQYLCEHGANIHHKSKNKVTLLMKAAEKGKTEIVRWLVAQGAKVEEKDARGWTALLYAVNFNHLETARYLVEEAKANIHAENNAGDTALSLAAMQGHLTIVQYLHKHGVDIHHKNKNKVTPLMKAAEKGKIEIVRWLVAQGAKIEEKDVFGWTALLYVVNFNHLETARYLVEEAKANIHAENNEGDTALSLAAMQGHLTIVQYLHKHGANIHHKSKNKVTPLMKAVRKGYLAIVQYLHKQGARVEEKNARGWTALLYAVNFNHLETARYLVEEAKANIHAENNEGDTALSLAVMEGHLAMAQYLYKHDADIHHKSNVTPLMKAARKGKTAIVRWLVTQGAKVEEKDARGWTALLYAVNFGHLETARYLVEEAKAEAQYLYERGADVHHQYKKNRTPLMVAAWEGKTEIVRWLVTQGAKVEEKDADGWTALLYAVNFNHLETARYLVEKAKANIHAEDNNGNTALSLAATEGNLAIVQYLYKHGADIHHKSKSNVTPLMEAARKRKTETVRWLVRQSAKVEEKDADGWTALFYAADLRHLETVHYLVEKAKANIHAEDNNGNTALSLAARKNHLAIVHYLHEQGADIHHQDKNNRTPLMEAVAKAIANGKTKTADWLIEQEILIKEKTMIHFTALFYAAIHRRTKAEEYLSKAEKSSIEIDLNFCKDFLTEEKWHNLIQGLKKYKIIKLVIDPLLMSEEKKNQLDGIVEENIRYFQLSESTPGLKYMAARLFFKQPEKYTYADEQITAIATKNKLDATAAKDCVESAINEQREHFGAKFKTS